MHSAAFFKTKRSKTLPMLKSSQIKVFCDLHDIQKTRKIEIFQNRGRPQGNIHKKGKRDFLRSPEPGRAGLGFILKPGREIKTGPGTVLNRVGPGWVLQKTGPGLKIRAGSQKPVLKQSGPGTVHPCNLLK